MPEGPEGTGCGARGRRHGLGGLRDNGPSNTSVTRPHRCEGQRRAWRARAAVPVSGGGAWPDVETTHRAGAAGVKGAGGTGGPGRGAGGRRQGQGGLRDRPLRAFRLACGDLAGGPPPTSTHSGQAHRQTIRRPEHQRRQSTTATGTQHHARHIKNRHPHRMSACGGARGIRTPDLLIANETRYQLRHSPKDSNSLAPSQSAMQADRAASPKARGAASQRFVCYWARRASRTASKSRATA